MRVVLEKSNNDRFFLNKLKKSLNVVLKRKNIIEFKKVDVLVDKMDLESAGTSNGVPPRKKFKHNVEKDISKRDLASLPKPVLQRIFSYLDVQSIQNCAILCSTLYNLSKDNSLYKTLNLNYNMLPQAIEYQISKVTHPQTLEIDYNCPLSQEEDMTWFNSCIINYTMYKEIVQLALRSNLNPQFRALTYWLLDFLAQSNIDVFSRVLRNCGDSIITLRIENCKNEEVLMHIGECINVERLILYKCKSNFSSLLSLCTLTSIQFSSCHFPPKVVREVIKNNVDLKHLHLSNNVNVNPNEICELMSKENSNMKEIHLSERKMLKTKSLRTLARLTNLRKLELISEPGFDCNPEDSLELLAAGCIHLEKLSIHNWKEINDTNFNPALRMFSQLKALELSGTSITIKSCREAALTLPLLKTLDVRKCQRIKRAQLILLRKDFDDIEIPLG